MIYEHRGRAAYRYLWAVFPDPDPDRAVLSSPVQSRPDQTCFLAWTTCSCSPFAVAGVAAMLTRAASPVAVLSYHEQLLMLRDCFAQLSRNLQQVFSCGYSSFTDGYVPCQYSGSKLHSDVFQTSYCITVLYYRNYYTVLYRTLSKWITTLKQAK